MIYRDESGSDLCRDVSSSGGVKRVSKFTEKRSMTAYEKSQPSKMNMN